MKKSPIILAFTITACCIGALFFLIQRKWLIIQWTFNAESNETALAKKETVLKKELTFYWWAKERLHQEKAPLIWRHDKNDENIKQTVNTWLKYLKGEKLIEQSITIDSVVLSPSEQDAYLSFNQSFNWKEWSIHRKWMLIDCLCKTLKSSDIPLKTISILVNHEPMVDDHLDFDHPWSIDGFTEEQ